MSTKMWVWVSDDVTPKALGSLKPSCNTSPAPKRLKLDWMRSA